MLPVQHICVVIFIAGTHLCSNFALQERAAEIEAMHTQRRLQVRACNLIGVELRANLQSIFHSCHLFEVAFVWELPR